MSIKLQDVLNLSGKDILKMNKEEVLEYTKIAVNRAKRRIDRLEEYFVDETPRSSIGKHWFENKAFSYSKNMTINELRHILNNARVFLTLEGSLKGRLTKRKDGDGNVIYTATGQRGIVLKLAERLNIDINKLTKSDINDLWNIYNEVRVEAINKHYSSDQLQKDIYDLVVENKNVDIKQIVKNKSQKIYREREKIEVEMEKEKEQNVDELFY